MEPRAKEELTLLLIPSISTDVTSSTEPQFQWWHQGLDTVTAVKGTFTAGKGTLTAVKGTFTAGKGTFTAGKGTFTAGQGTITAGKGTITEPTLQLQGDVTISAGIPEV